MAGNIFLPFTDTNSNPLIGAKVTMEAYSPFLISGSGANTIGAFGGPIACFTDPVAGTASFNNVVPGIYVIKCTGAGANNPTTYNIQPVEKGYFYIPELSGSTVNGWIFYLQSGSAIPLTGSWAYNAVYAQFALSSSYLNGNSLSASYALTASVLLGNIISSSYALSASYAATSSYSNNFFVNGQITSPNPFIGFGSEQFGNGASAGANNATAIGQGTIASTHGLAIGQGALSIINFDTAVGSTAIAGGGNSTAIGYFASASGLLSTVIGSAAVDNGFQHSVALGAQSSCTANNQIMLGRSTSTVVTSGSLLVLGNTTCNNLIGTASWSNNAISASYAPSSGGGGLSTGSTYPVTASWSTNALTASSINFTPNNCVTSSYSNTASLALTASSINFTPSSASYAISSSHALTSSLALTASSISFNPTSASYALSASYAPSSGGGGGLSTGSTYPITSSWSTNTITASYALTASFAISSSVTVLHVTSSISASFASASISSSFASTIPYYSSTQAVGGTTSWTFATGLATLHGYNIWMTFVGGFGPFSSNVNITLDSFYYDTSGVGTGPYVPLFGWQDDTSGNITVNAYAAPANTGGSIPNNTYINVSGGNTSLNGADYGNIKVVAW